MFVLRDDGGGRHNFDIYNSIKIFGVHCSFVDDSLESLSLPLWELLNKTLQNTHSSPAVFGLSHTHTLRAKVKEYGLRRIDSDTNPTPLWYNPTAAASGREKQKKTSKSKQIRQQQQQYTTTATHLSHCLGR